MFTVRVVTTLREFETLADQWTGLLKGTKADNIFLTWEWQYTWARHFLGQQRLWIVLVYDGGRLVGIAPFYIREHSASMVKVREILFLATEGVGSSYLDFIVSEGDKKAVLYSIYRHLHEEARGLWDVLTLGEIPAESRSLDLWDGFVGEVGRVVEIVGMTACPFIALTERVEDFLSSLSGNERYNLRRKQRWLEEMGQVAYQRASSDGEIEKAMDVFIRLHQMRWGQKGSGGVFRSDQVVQFHLDIARLFSEKGWIQLDFLLLDGEMIAGIYGYGYNGRYSFYLPGFNPAIAPKASPGILLLFHRIEKAIEEEYRVFDLLRGAPDYKIAWANGLRRSLTLRYYNRHLRAAGMKLVESGKSVVKVLVR